MTEVCVDLLLFIYFTSILVERMEFFFSSFVACGLYFPIFTLRFTRKWELDMGTGTHINILRVAVISAKNHKRQRRKLQSVTAKREKSQTPKVLTAILTLRNLT